MDFIFDTDSRLFINSKILHLVAVHLQNSSPFNIATLLPFHPGALMIKFCKGIKMKLIDTLISPSFYQMPSVKDHIFYGDSPQTDYTVVP